MRRICLRGEVQGKSGKVAMASSTTVRTRSVTAQRQFAFHSRRSSEVRLADPSCLQAPDQRFLCRILVAERLLCADMPSLEAPRRPEVAMAQTSEPKAQGTVHSSDADAPSQLYGCSMPSRADQAFHDDMVTGAHRLKRRFARPDRFNQMVAEHGGPEAVRLLLKGRDASDGFTTLWEHSRLEMSCEAIALLPWYEDLFSANELAVARRQLTEHNFDVDGFIQEASANPPSWWQKADQS